MRNGSRCLKGRDSVINLSDIQQEDRLQFRLRIFEPFPVSGLDRSHQVKSPPQSGKWVITTTARGGSRGPDLLMGQGISCSERHETAFFRAVQTGDLEMVKAMVKKDPRFLKKKNTGYSKSSCLHMAALNGQIEVLCFLLDCYGRPDILNRFRQTPLMLAARTGKSSCVRKLIESGAYVLMFDSLQGRTCLHYAACYGHFDSLQVLLSAARDSSLTDSWGFSRFVNIRDQGGATPLHLAAREGFSNCIRILLENGALVCASTNGNGFPGSTALHYAARGGSLECVRELLAWGAERHQPDSFGRIPYIIALKYKHEACAALLNPASPEPLVWPLPARLITSCNPEAKELLEKALMEANMEREETIIREINHSLPSASSTVVKTEDDVSESEMVDVNVCCICFEKVCTIEIQECSHQMCAHCILALCCHRKPNPETPVFMAPLCPFCRSSITQVAVAELSIDDSEVKVSPRMSSPKIISNDTDGKASPPRASVKTPDNETEAGMSPPKPIKSRKSNCIEGSSSLRGLSAISSFGKMSIRNSGKFSSESK